MLNPDLPPGQNFDLSSYLLQTLDAKLQFTEVNPIGSYQDAYFFTDPSNGRMNFQVPSGAGHTEDSEYPRVELREIVSWMMDSQGPVRSESVTLTVLEEPKTGKTIFAQIHGEKVGGSEALKMWWNNGTVSMGVKKRYGDAEEQIQFSLLPELALGDTIECHMELRGDTLTVDVRSEAASETHSFQYDATSWQGNPLYFKVGVYSQDKDVDGSVGSIAVHRLELIG
jgi:hypothetical protein